MLAACLQGYTKKLSVIIWCDSAGDERIFIRGIVAQHGFRERYKHGGRESSAKVRNSIVKLTHDMD